MNWNTQFPEVLNWKKRTNLRTLKFCIEKLKELVCIGFVHLLKKLYSLNFLNHAILWGSQKKKEFSQWTSKSISLQLLTMNQQIKHSCLHINNFNSSTKYVNFISLHLQVNLLIFKTPMTRGWKQHSRINQIYFFLQLTLHSALVCFRPYMLQHLSYAILNSA